MNDKIKKLTRSRVSLAPMAGITDYVLRSLVRKYSETCLLTTEMISSEFLAQSGNTEISKLDNSHHPIAYQISGHKPHLIEAAARRLSGMADIIDINMGCPVNKVVKGQDGCALMRTPELAADLVCAAKSGGRPVSVKFRLGYTSEELNFTEFGQKMQDAGAEFITIHGRTRSQMYSGKADWSLIRRLKENVDIPVFANGDVVDIESAVRCLEQSGADGVAIGRGMLGDPSLPHRIEHHFETGEKLPPPTLQEKIEILKQHLDEEIKLRGENAGIKFVRKFYPYYISGVPNAAKLRGALVTEDDYGKIIQYMNFCNDT
ncbi:MAG: tRNA-dihydrouridine synthase [Heliobacteriaceae bacterium]|jgi:tRNA-dihydrouridine synthase B|nr:tRNA-dihydrouridine synthase [Heliobacteriaceae bacterium]